MSANGLQLMLLFVKIKYAVQKSWRSGLQKVCLKIWFAFLFMRTLKFGGQMVSRFYPIRVPSVV